MFINETGENVMLWKLFSLFNLLQEIFSRNWELGENVVPLTLLSFVSQGFVCCEIGRKLISQHPLTRQADRKWELVHYWLMLLTDKYSFVMDDHFLLNFQRELTEWYFFLNLNGIGIVWIWTCIWFQGKLDERYTKYQTSLFVEWIINLK